MTWTLKISLLSWWHTGTGAAAGDLDATVRRSADGLPEFGGKAVRGLLRSGADLVEPLRAPFGFERLSADGLFGDQREPGVPGSGAEHGGWIECSSACLPEAWRQWAAAADPGTRRRIAAFYESVAQTALEEGVTRDGSLRRIEVVMPLDLEAHLSLRAGHPFAGQEETVGRYLALCAALVSRMGRARHRGLGRCRWQLSSGAPDRLQPVPLPEPSPAQAVS